MTAATRTPVLKSRLTARQKRALLTGLLFISPWLIRFLALNLYPLFASIYYSFTYYDIINPPDWIGLGNYDKMLHEYRLHEAMLNTVWFVFTSVPGHVIVGFVLALLLNQDIRFRPWFRAIFYLPAIVPIVAVAMLWSWILHPQFGLTTNILALLGRPAIPWLASPSWAKPALLLVLLWNSGGAMIIFLAALQDVPAHLYDAAKIDGANALQCLWHVTIPMCTPAIFYVTLTGLIGTFQMFGLPYIMTGGGPAGATNVYAVELYSNAFDYLKMGYASAMAWILFVVVVTASLLLFRTTGRWVHYGGQ